MNINDYKYRIELHTHSYPGSGCSSVSPERLVELYKQYNCDAVVITNHFHIKAIGIYRDESYFYEFLKDKDNMVDMYLEGYRRAYEAGKKLGINVLLGMELCLKRENSNDYLIYGIDEAFVKKTIDYMEKTLAEFYTEMKTDKNVIIKAHPGRKNKKYATMPKEYLDGVETLNLQPGHNSRNAEALEYARDENFGITTCGSDFHNEFDCALAVIRTKTLPKDSVELATILKSHDYLFDISGSIIIPQGFCG